MIFGNASNFAVEFELDEPHEDVWLYGRYCYWIKGIRVGDYNLVSSLRDVMNGITWYIIPHNGNRTHIELYNLNTNELYNRLYNSYYGEESADEQKALEENWQRFEISIQVETFDRWSIYLVENDVKTRIIARNLDTHKITEFELIPREFDEAITLAYNKLLELHTYEVSKMNN